jgi:hypothetical protein
MRTLFGLNARGVKTAALAGVVVSACAVPTASMADPSSSSPVGPSATSQVTNAPSGPLPSGPLSASPSLVVQPQNIKSGVCNTFAGAICYVYFRMDPGLAATSFLFNNGQTRITDTHCYVPSLYCDVVARGIPAQANIEVLTFDVTGPNIRNVTTGV